MSFFKLITYTSLILLESLIEIPFALATPQKVDAVVTHLVGIMDTSPQALLNPKAPSVRMTTCKVQVKESNNTYSVYLYQEQALTKTLLKPYRQRFLQIKSTLEPEIIESKSFKPPEQNKLINLCSQPEQLRIFELKDLGEPVCSVFLKQVGDDFIGETPPQGCPTNIRGAVKITNTIILNNLGMDTLDKGYDAQGNQVWGAKEQAYQFRWILN